MITRMDLVLVTGRTNKDGKPVFLEAFGVKLFFFSMNNLKHYFHIYCVL